MALNLERVSCWKLKLSVNALLMVYIIIYGSLMSKREIKRKELKKKNEWMRDVIMWCEWKTLKNYHNSLEFPVQS